MQHLLRIGVVAIGNRKIDLTIQVVWVMDKENLVIVDVVLGKTCYRGIRMKLGLDSSAS